MTEKEGRVLIGVGARHARRACPRSIAGDNPLGTIAWECMAQHSIRPDFKDGFLLPYHEALERGRQPTRLSIPTELVAFAPDDAWREFSYGCGTRQPRCCHHRLVACEHALQAPERICRGQGGQELQWLSDRLGELWKLRGPCPGLGSALEAFGVEQGALLVRKLAPLMAENEDPWALVERAMEDPRRVRPGLEQTWGSISGEVAGRSTRSGALCSSWSPAST